jgi:hypothetical protein
LEQEDAELDAQYNNHKKMKQSACSLVIELDQSKEDRAVVVVGSELIKLVKVRSLLSLYPVSSGGDGVCDVVEVVMKTDVFEVDVHL